MKGNFRLFQGSFMDHVDEILKLGIDAVITDPPYGIDGSRGGGNKKRGKGNYDSPFADTPEYIQDVIVPIIKLLIKRVPLVVFTPGIRCMSLYPAPRSFGCFYQPSATGMQTHGHVDSHPIFYYGSNLTKQNMGKRLSTQMVTKPMISSHPCPKPLASMEFLIHNQTKEGMTILDPFMGVGTTGIACAKLGRKFVGCELAPNYFSEARNNVVNAFGGVAPSFKDREGQRALFWEAQL